MILSCLGSVLFEFGSLVSFQFPEDCFKDRHETLRSSIKEFLCLLTAILKLISFDQYFHRLTL